MSNGTGAPLRDAPPAPTAASAGPRWFGACLWLHRWTGLVATPFFLVLCLTGSVLIFHEEVDQLLGDRPAASEAAGTESLPLGRLVEAALASRPGSRPLYVGLDAEEPDRAIVGLGPPEATRLEQAVPVLVSRHTGELLAFTDPRKTVTGFLLELHAKWFLGIPGQLLGGLVALLVLACLATGVVVHAPFVRRLLFGTVRRGRGARIVQLDLHNLVGVVVLGWVTLVTVSGVLLAAGAVLVPLWQATELREMAGQDATAPAEAVSVDVAADAASRAMPDRAVRFVFFPGTEFSSPRHYTALAFGTHRTNERLFDVALVDAGTSQVAAARPLPLYLQSVLVSEPLHFGNYGGLPLKLLWVGSAWAALFITGNGAWLWWQRRRRRRAARAGQGAVGRGVAGPGGARAGDARGVRA